MNSTRTIPFVSLCLFFAIGGPCAHLANAGNVHAFLWTSANGMQDLGTLGGDRSEARAINDDGVVVGWSDSPGNIAVHAFRWTVDGGMIDLGTPSGFTSSIALAINAGGDIAGQATTTDDSTPFFWSASSGFVNLLESSTANLKGFAQGINDRQEVTGQIFTRLGVGYVFIWSPRLKHPELIDLGDDDIVFPGGRAINNRGHITGYAYDTHGDFHTFFWSREGGIRKLLRNRNYISWAINDSDDVTGVSNSDPTGFYWKTARGTAITLQTLDSSTSGGTAINESGAIAGAVGNHAALWSDPPGCHKTSELFPEVLIPWA